MKPNICLVMIVRDEAHVLARCLESALPLISSWVIVDTGSTDGTQMVACEAVGRVPGLLVDVPWTDFGTARTTAFELARGGSSLDMSNPAPKPDYYLVLDADEVIVRDPLQCWPDLTAECYALQQANAGSGFTFPTFRLFRADLPWRYDGVRHEHPEIGRPFHAELLNGISILHHCDSARRRDPDRFRKDAEALELDFDREPTARNAYYVGQSWRDAGRPLTAAAWYQRRGNMTNGWEEERAHALFKSAQCLADAHEPVELVDAAFTAAINARPTRAEPWYWWARYQYGIGRLACALSCAMCAAKIGRDPMDSLFIESSVYGPEGDAAELIEEIQQKLAGDM